MDQRERIRYSIWVLWLRGHDAAFIARVVRLRRSQTLGVAQRSPWKNRSEMTLAQRQAALDELFAIRVGADGKRIDGGFLSHSAFIAEPLETAQVRK